MTFPNTIHVGAVLDDSSVDIAIDVRGYHNLPSKFHDSRVCLGLASHGERVLESCFEQVNWETLAPENRPVRFVPDASFPPLEGGGQQAQLVLIHRIPAVFRKKPRAIGDLNFLRPIREMTRVLIGQNKRVVTRLLPIVDISLRRREQGTTDLVFHASGLLAGQSYSLRAVLFERSNALAVSMRSFRVGAVSISDGVEEASPVTIQVLTSPRCHRVSSRTAQPAVPILRGRGATKPCRAQSPVSFSLFFCFLPDCSSGGSNSPHRGWPAAGRAYLQVRRSQQPPVLAVLSCGRIPVVCYVLGYVLGLSLRACTSLGFCRRVPLRTHDHQRASQ